MSAVAVMTCGLFMLGCDQSSGSAAGTSGGQSESSRYTDTSGDPLLLKQNQESLELLETCIATAEEVLALLRSITDDASAEAALPQLQALSRRVVNDEEAWQFTGRGTVLFANEEARAAWEAQSKTFAALREPLLTERNRIKDASDGNERSPMVRAFYAFRHLP